MVLKFLINKYLRTYFLINKILKYLNFFFFFYFTYPDFHSDWKEEYATSQINNNTQEFITQNHYYQKN